MAVGRSRPARVILAGAGNADGGDDAAGLVAVDRLRERELPPWVRTVKVGTDSLRLLDLWRGEPEVWLVDATQTGAEPGSWRVLEHEEVLRIPQAHASAHALSLPENLRWLAVAEPRMRSVRYRLFAVEAARIAPGGEMSREVRLGVEGVVERIAAELARWDPADPDEPGPPWSERKASSGGR